MNFNIVSSFPSKDYKNYNGIFNWGEYGAPSEGFASFNCPEGSSYINVVHEKNGHLFPLDFYDNKTTNINHEVNNAIISSNFNNQSHFISFWVLIDSEDKSFMLRTTINDYLTELYRFEIHDNGFHFLGKAGRCRIMDIDTNRWYHVCISNMIHGNNFTFGLYIDGILAHVDDGISTGEKILYSHFLSSPKDNDYHVYLDALYVGLLQKEAFESFGGLISYGEAPNFILIPEKTTYLYGTSGNYLEWVIFDDTVNKTQATYSIFRNNKLITNNNSLLWNTNQPIKVNIDGLDVGDYFYRISITDGFIGNISDTVKVIVYSNKLILSARTFINSLNFNNLIYVGILGLASIVFNKKLTKV
ncbi:hypothetical protein [Candidatus Lokiarchaeum ossiferum]|uniref:hypothetical protein n=1 Tax=Candidatus Lokiarchaeum ossiferum TaxID=2951803 RepID=UPI00352DAF7A